MLKLSPNKFSNAGLYLRVVGEGIDHFFLVHVHLKAAQYKTLDLCTAETSSRRSQMNYLTNPSKINTHRKTDTTRKVQRGAITVQDLQDSPGPVACDCVSTTSACGARRVRCALVVNMLKDICKKKFKKKQILTGVVVSSAEKH